MAAERRQRTDYRGAAGGGVKPAPIIEAAPGKPPANASKRGRTASGGLLVPLYGKQILKAYPLTEDQIETLSGLGLLAAGCFTVAGACLGFAIDLTKDLRLAAGIDPAALAWWEGVNYASFGGSAVFFVAGFLFWYWHGSKLKKIKDNTIF